MPFAENLNFIKMKNQEILRELLRERARRALRVHEKKFLEECQKLKLSRSTLYDFINYERSYMRKPTIQKIYFATKVILG